MTGPVLIIFALVVLVGLAGLLSAARHTARTGGVTPSWAHLAEAEPADTTPEPTPYRAPRALPRKTSSPRGAIPPVTPSLVTVQLSDECANDMCGMCPRTGGCECSCDHDSAKIQARYKAAYDQAHGTVPA